MTLSQKVALSLLLSVIFFAGFTVLAYTGLFDLVEAKFYNPSITSSVTKQMDRDAIFVDSFLETQKTRFFSTLEEASVTRSFLPSQSAGDIFERSRIYGTLLEDVSGLQWIRFIDSGGVRLHYSSRPEDILRQDELSTAYRNFTEAETGLSYDDIAAADQGRARIIFDGNGNRFLFSFPFYDSFDVFRGTALFSVSIRSMEEAMMREGLIKIGENITVISSPSGLVLGIPVNAENDLYERISSIWNEGEFNFNLLDSSDSGVSFVLVSGETPGGIFLGRMIDEDVFEFPQMMKIILLLSFFFTIYLTVFLILNLRQDSFTVVQNRLKRLQISLIEQYYEHKNDMDWGQWSRELEQRREEIRGELKQGVKTPSPKKDKDGKNDIDVLIDKSWDELLGVIGGRRETGINEEKLKAILNKIIAAPSGQTALQPGAAANKESAYYQVTAQETVEKPDAVAELAEEAETIEEIEELEELTETVEEAEVLEELPEIVEEAEALEEVTEVAEEIEELEELTETVEETETIEELAEAVEEIEALEEVTKPVEQAEAIEKIEELEELVEPVEQTEAIEELSEVVEEAEVLEEAAEAVEEIEALEEVAGPLEQAEALEELVEVVEEAEAFEEVTEVVEEIEELEELAETVEEAEALEGLSEVVEEVEAFEEEAAEALEEIEAFEELTESAEEVEAFEEETKAVEEIELAEGATESLEELESFEEIEELEEIETTVAEETVLAGESPNLISEMELDNLASQIEFSSYPEIEEDDGIDGDLEVVSPFDSMSFDFDQDDESSAGPDISDNSKKKRQDLNERKETASCTAELVTLSANTGTPFFYRPFMLRGGGIETLETLPVENGAPQTPVVEDEGQTLIQEREGVPYINQMILDTGPQTVEELNQDFKKLVDSVISVD